MNINFFFKKIIYIEELLKYNFIKCYIKLNKKEKFLIIFYYFLNNIYLNFL